MTKVRFFFAFLRKDFLEELGHRGNLLLHFLGIAVQCLTFYSLGQMVDQVALQSQVAFRNGYFPYFIMGMGMFQLTQGGLSYFVQAVRKEKANGTLEALWLGTTSPVTLLVSIGLWPFVNQLFLLLGLVGMGGALSPILLQKISWGLFGVSLILAFLLYVSLGLLLVSWSFAAGRVEFWVNLYGSLNLILAGVAFPVSLLPRFFQTLSEFFPLTHLLRFARAGELGFGRETLFEGLVLLSFSLFLFVATPFCLKTALRRAEQEGSLAHS